MSTALEKTKTINVPEKLTGPNFLTWEDEMQLVFLDEGLAVETTVLVPEGANPFVIKDSHKSALIILKSVVPTINAALFFHKTATEKWNFLYRTYSGRNVARKYQGSSNFPIWSWHSCREL